MDRGQDDAHSRGDGHHADPRAHAGHDRDDRDDARRALGRARYGYDEAAGTIQDLYLAGRKAEAEAAVPDALVDDVALCGPRERIRERLGVWKSAGITTLMVGGDTTALRTMAELVL